MAKKPQANVEVKVDAKVLATQKRREQRIARHMKKHENDAQTANAPKEGAIRKAPKVKGNFPAKKHWVYDATGAKTEFSSSSKDSPNKEIWEISKENALEDRKKKGTRRGKKSGSKA
ncbi:hypothetical protein HOU41_gp118 [Proteus phage Stubb]|uniref:Uncharacterized protein n=1 Tax=Proteus phage Stubb TaxID=2315597 RepID=A0A3B8DJ53_9CAUD|nr:hypothetical protein HOU41_gp118 [Proteus phage Stubb]AYJ73226.1 hypothetical protein CPT_Stubb_110 [Proteus phage Stubb]